MKMRKSSVWAKKYQPFNMKFFKESQNILINRIQNFILIHDDWYIFYSILYAAYALDWWTDTCADENNLYFEVKILGN